MERATPDELDEHLRAVSEQLYGERVALRAVDPRSLKPLPRNARYFTKTTFDQLVANIERDRLLASVPYCLEHAGELLIVSGNHRVKAAVKASIPRILVFVEQWDGSLERKVEVQLSHNALVGQDDKQLLAEAWGTLKTLEAKLYAGLDSKLIAELEKIRFSGFGPQPLPMESMTLWFLPEEVKRIDDLLQQALGVAQSRHTLIAPLEKYEELWGALVKVKRLSGIKNTAVAFMVLIDAIAQVADKVAQEERDAGGTQGVEAGGSGD